MIGNATQLFLQSGESLPILYKKARPRADWGVLQGLLTKGCLNEVDLAIAEELLARILSPSQAIAALICHLSLSVRMGHLCVSISEKSLEPSIVDLWERDTPLSDQERDEVGKLVFQGSQEVTRELLTPIEKLEDVPTTPLCRFGTLFYFQKYWMMEAIVHQTLAKLIHIPLTLQVNEELVEVKLRNLETKGVLLPEQAQAVRMVLHSTLSILCGGPGTGKTYTAGQMIKLLLESLPNDAVERCRIVLAAPTGKAAANLQKSLNNNGLNLRATTLHHLLGINSQNHKAVHKRLSADIILVDESSMIDADLMGHLLMAVKPGARLIFLGDPYQLPPVESGSLFSGMLQSKQFPSVELKTCMRAELKELVEFAEAINQGSYEKVKKLLEGTQVVQRARETDVVQLFERLSLLFPVEYNSTGDDGQAIEKFNQFRLLCPVRKGAQGVDEINRIFYERLVKTRLRKHDVMVPIMLIRNDSRLELANGETGVLVLTKGDRDGVLRQGDFAIFRGKEGGVRRIPALLLPAYEYAYCMSVHKSQGSEFNHVYLWMPEGSQNFGREVLYTAITRARQKLEISASDTILNTTIQKQSKRMSLFMEQS